MTEADGELAVEVVKAMGMIEPEEVAEAVSAGLANDDFLILPTPKSRATSSTGLAIGVAGSPGCASSKRRCRARESVSLDPITASIYRRTAVGWRDARIGRSLAPADRLAAAFDDIPAAPVLDVGCGPGLLIPGLPGTVIGLDPVAEMLELLPDHAPGRSRAGSR